MCDKRVKEGSPGLHLKKALPMMAAAVGCRIIGLDTARLDDGDFEIDELEDLTKEGNERVYMYAEDARGMGRYADRLQTEKVELSAEVNIVWLTE